MRFGSCLRIHWELGFVAKRLLGLEVNFTIWPRNGHFLLDGTEKKLLMSFYVVLDPAVTLTRVSLVRWRGCINLINTGNSRNLLTDLHSASMQWSFWIPELLMGDIKFYYLQPGEWSTKHWSSPFHVTHVNYPIHSKGTWPVGRHIRGVGQAAVLWP